MPFGFVIDDDSPDKKALGAGEFAAALAERESDEAAHLAACPSCGALGEAFGCVGVIDTPIPAAIEQWLVARLPEDIESLPGFLLRKALADYNYDGAFGRLLRAQQQLTAPGAFTRHFGPFFRRFTVSSEQLLEELLGAGDVNPAHALLCLAHLGALSVDGRVLATMGDGPKYGELVQDPACRRERTRCTIAIDAADDAALVQLKRYLRALWAGFVVDAPVKIFGAPAE